MLLAGCGEPFTSQVFSATPEDGGAVPHIDALPFGSGGSGGGVEDAGPGTGGRVGPHAGGAPGTGGVGTGGSPSTGGVVGSGGSLATGGAVGPGGSPSSGGAGTGGSTGGSPSTGGTGTGGGSGGTSTGGALNSGGTPGSGGVADAGCTPVPHDNGLGQTWQDCVPLGTYNQSQAVKACKASFADLCAPDADPQYSCQGVGGVGVIVNGQVHQWVYVIRPGAGVQAGDILEFAQGSFVCPSFPGATGRWR